MDKTRRSLIASAAAAAASPAALSALGVTLFSQASHAADTLETSAAYTPYDSGALYQVPKLMWVNNEPGPNGTFYTGWMGQMIGIDFLEIYRAPANNGAGFTGSMVHWQAYYKNGKKYRRGIELAKFSFNTDGAGKLFATWKPDGNDLYTDVRHGGSSNAAEIRVKNCASFSSDRELWPANLVPYGGIAFNDDQLSVVETVSFAGYRRTAFWGFTSAPGTANRTAQLFYRISMALPQSDTTTPFRWHTRVELASSAWSTGTLLVAEGFMRQYAAASISRWGRAPFALAAGGGVWNTFQASNHYASQNINPGQMVIGTAMLVATLLLYIGTEAALWTTLASASSNGDRIAVHYTTQSNLDASNNLVGTIYGYSNSASPINSTTFFTNTVDGQNTAVLWAGPPYTGGQNPANLVGICTPP